MMQKLLHNGTTTTPFQHNTPLLTVLLYWLCSQLQLWLGSTTRRRTRAFDGFRAFLPTLVQTASSIATAVAVMMTLLAVTLEMNHCSQPSCFGPKHAD